MVISRLCESARTAFLWESKAFLASYNKLKHQDRFMQKNVTVRPGKFDRICETRLFLQDCLSLLFCNRNVFKYYHIHKIINKKIKFSFVKIIKTRCPANGITRNA